jgi:nucleoid DNA-binding protein
MTITKAAITERLTDELGLNKQEGKEFIESFFY